ncbi:ABC transporter permease [Microbacterium marinilacus]|uniref:ABC transporter permease n=1 Tax=Microbacterium marinilacus TaxID=415209 RepID=A0ABP7BL26_9MICO|nr:ABC transporter permease [Microbacterium marinilacus]
MDLWHFVSSRAGEILFASAQHFSLVVQSLIVATTLSILIAALVYTGPTRTSIANAVSAVGLTIPSFALIGMLIAPLGFGVAPAVVVIVFFGSLPILRNAIVGLRGVERSVIESARGIGMSQMDTFFRIELPLAWPIILAGIRVSAQMVMGIAAVAAFVLGPGLGGFIFQGLSRLGGAGSLESIITGTVGVVILAAILDLILVGVGRLTTSKGIRV